MQTQDNILHCYNKTAEAYAEKFNDELSAKHFDRILLQAFVSEVKDNGHLVDFGCGPGQTTRYLYNCGISAITGADLSPEMVRVARRLHPSITFETADMLSLAYPDNYFGAAVAFYAIVHFSYQQAHTAFKEIHRVLKSNGHFLFSFHTGHEVIHHDTFLGHEVNIDFHFFEPQKIKELLIKTGFEMIDLIERDPYQHIEHPSRRTYIWVKKVL